jgi:VWFA-related protein
MTRLRTAAPFLLALVLAFGPCAAPHAQISQDRDRDKHKPRKFGSSLDQFTRNGEQGADPDLHASNDHDTNQRDEILKLDTLLVVFDVLVLAQGRSRTIDGLNKGDFTVREDGQPQQIVSFGSGSDIGAPRSIILIIDHSPSQSIYLSTSIDAAKTLVSKLGPRDDMAIVTDDVELLVDLTRDQRKLLSALDSLKKHAVERDRFGRSFQFSALFAALRELAPVAESRPIIVFQTDGDEAAAFRDQPDPARFAFLWGRRPAVNFGLNDIFKAANESRATIYSVITNERLIGYPQEEYRERVKKLLERRREAIRNKAEAQIGPNASNVSDSEVRLWGEIYGRGQLASERVAVLSGGWTEWLERPEQASEIYQRILSDINRRYVIGYYPTNTARDGKLRKVTIEVRGHPEYEIHGRTTYRAPRH